MVTGQIHYPERMFDWVFAMMAIFVGHQQPMEVNGENVSFSFLELNHHALSLLLHRPKNSINDLHVSQPLFSPNIQMRNTIQ